jgi:transcriptional regulator with XRE-family HTH domain
MHRTLGDKIAEIYHRSGLSISKFAHIVNKDRRTVSGWIDKHSVKPPNHEVQNLVAQFFRYPMRIWEEGCQEDEFINLLTQIPQEEIRIIDEGYLGGLKYILEHEYQERFVIHPQFPGPVYRDTTVPRVYRTVNSSDIETFKQKRTKMMLDYAFESTEWYSIKALLIFCFSDIGNFYTKEQKIQILSLIIQTFEGNFNKSLYFFDSHSRKIYGLDTAYTSINIKAGVMFFKAPLESVFIEIRNKKLISRIHRHFTYGPEAPSHVNPRSACAILRILLNCIQEETGIVEAYERINRQSDYGGLFYNNISIQLQPRLTPPKVGQKRS